MPRLVDILEGKSPEEKKAVEENIKAALYIQRFLDDTGTFYDRNEEALKGALTLANQKARSENK
jgi:hypothetical protein